MPAPPRLLPAATTTGHCAAITEASQELQPSILVPWACRYFKRNPLRCQSAISPPIVSRESRTALSGSWAQKRGYWGSARSRWALFSVQAPNLEPVFSLPQCGAVRGLGSSASLWQDAATAMAAAATARRNEPRQKHKRETQQDEESVGTLPMSSTGPAAAAQAKTLSQPKALDGVYFSSFYLAFLAAVHATSPVASASTAAAAEAARGCPRLRGAIQKREAATERLLMLTPHHLPSVAHVGATAARMQKRLAASPLKRPGAPPDGALWQRELAAVIGTTSEAAAAFADRAFWGAFCQAAAVAADAFSPSEASRIAMAAAASVAAGAPGWARLYEPHQKLILALQEHIRRQAKSYSLFQLLAAVEALQRLQALPSATRPAATAAASTASAEASAAAAAFTAAEIIERPKRAAAAAAAATLCENTSLMLHAAEAALHAELTKAASTAERAAEASKAAGSLEATSSRAAAPLATAAPLEKQRPQSTAAFCSSLLRSLRIYAGSGSSCPMLLQFTINILRSRSHWFSIEQLVDLAEMLLDFRVQQQASLEFLHPFNAQAASANKLSLKELLRLLRAYGGLGVTSPSLVSAALSHFGCSAKDWSDPADHPLPCRVAPEAAEAVALRAVAASALSRCTATEQQEHELLLRCSKAYASCMADAEVAAALAGTAPEAVDPKDQSALVLLQCLLQQQALDRRGLLLLLPTLRLELQLQCSLQQKGPYLQKCGLVLSSFASCGVQLLHLWGELLSPLFLPPAATPSAQVTAASATQWGSWLLSRPLLQHVKTTVSAGIFCGITAAGSGEEAKELLQVAAAAAEHSAAAITGFLCLLQRSSSSDGLGQLTEEALEELAADICKLLDASGVAAVLLHLLHQQQQERQHADVSCTAVGAAAAVRSAPIAASAATVKIQGLQELLAAEIPEMVSEGPRQQQKTQLQRLLEQQLQPLLQQHQGLLFELLVELGCRGAPRNPEELPSELLVAVEAAEGESLDLRSTWGHTALLFFLQSALRGAMPLLGNSSSREMQGAEGTGHLPTSLRKCSRSLTSAKGPTVGSLLLLATLLERPREDVPLVHHLLQLIVLLPAAEGWSGLSTAVNRFVLHLRSFLLAVRLQKRNQRCSQDAFS
ncbi:uncharacterized protein LOC34623196 [Cyclospora cayetanensis]|uniref:Uncharacterized protein LOC34623196 n=1 Tax=Cyclospora cayetanensis TaxID=88456 RepID=A0A6P6S0P1_9EIME|nr:uncharacterized protein LOC34623196 [Cyclospora cayetanensis]